MPLSRRRPADALPPRPIARAADRAAKVANKALGERRARAQWTLDQAGLRARPQGFLVLVASGMVVLFALGLLIWGPIPGLLLLAAGP